MFSNALPVPKVEALKILSSTISCEVSAARISNSVVKQAGHTILYDGLCGQRHQCHCRVAAEGRAANPEVWLLQLPHASRLLLALNEMSSAVYFSHGQPQSALCKMSLRKLKGLLDRRAAEGGSAEPAEQARVDMR